MTPENWKRVESVLEGALDLASTDRSAYLDRACGGDTTMRREIETLLSYEVEAGQVVAGAVENAAELFQTPELGLTAGERIGVYRVVREIGRGGMGTVYLAERDDQQFQRQVAIKLVTRGMDTLELLERFRRERQILARLDHPFIARLLDGGSTADGRPFLVMEYVEGARITAWCVERSLPTRERVELFRKVCAAVQCAHQNLVVHRDLKPGNILVDAEGSPKLLDFGIAKLMEADDGPQFTVIGSPQLLTPDYASPEQVRNGPITTATDVYSLGVILYELVAGVRPHRLQNYSPTEIEIEICEKDPEKPSTARRLAAGRGETASAPPLEAGDLDNIILKAMQKEPSRRYGSPAELAEDLRRYLEGMPVSAREDTLRYRMRKFIRRNRGAVAAAAMLLATLAGGVTVSAIEARRAQRRFAEVRRIAHAVLYDIHDAIRDLPGSVKAREIVVKTALEYLDNLARESAGDSGLQLELAEAYERVGDVQGNAISNSLGHTADALESYRKSARIADALANSRGAPPKVNLLRMRLRQNMGEIQVSSGKIAEGLESIHQGEEIGDNVDALDPANLKNLSDLTNLYLANARNEVDTTRSMAAARRAIVLAERLSAAQPDSQDDRLVLSDAHSMVGTILLRNNVLNEAFDEIQKATTLREALVAADPVNIRYKRDLMIAYAKLGDVLGPITPSLLDGPRALENYHKALALARTLASDPADKRAAYDLGMALMKTATAMPADRDHVQALATLHEALAVFERLAQGDATSARLQIGIGTVNRHLAECYLAAGDTASAIRSERVSLAIARALVSKDAKNLTAQRMLWGSSRDLAANLAAQKQRSEALELAETAIAAAQAIRKIDGANAFSQAFLPTSYATAGAIQAGFAADPAALRRQRLEDWTRAKQWFEQSASEWEQIHPQGGWPRDRDQQLARARAEAARCASALAELQ